MYWLPLRLCVRYMLYIKILFILTRHWEHIWCSLCMHKHFSCCCCCHSQSFCGMFFGCSASCVSNVFYSKRERYLACVVSEMNLKCLLAFNVWPNTKWNWISLRIIDNASCRLFFFLSLSSTYTIKRWIDALTHTTQRNCIYPQSISFHVYFMVHIVPER